MKRKKYHADVKQKHRDHSNNISYQIVNIPEQMKIIKYHAHVKQKHRDHKHNISCPCLTNTNARVTQLVMHEALHY